MGILDPESITRLWDEHGAALVLYARQWCGAPEDVVQEAFLLLVRQQMMPENPTGWLYRVVRNRAINVGRSRRRQRDRETAVAADRQSWFKPTADDRIDADAATEALKELSAQEREAIVARLWGGLSFKEIGRLSGTSTATVHRSYQRGLAALRERLGWSCHTKRTNTKTRI